MTTHKALFIHDCKVCVPCGGYTYAGRHYDLYYCASKEYPALSSLIARWGDEGASYAASHPPEAFCVHHQEEWERLVISRAREQGVFLEPRPKVLVLGDDAETR